MKDRIVLILSVILFFLFTFIVGKTIFLFVHTPILSDFSFDTFWSVFTHGILYDVTMTAYLAVIPIFLILLSVWLNRRIIAILSNLYFFLSIAFITIIMVYDMLLYPSLGFRLSYDSFINLVVSEHNFISKFVVQFIIGGFVSISIIFALYMIYVYSIKRKIDKLKVPRTISKTFLVLFLFGITLIVPIKLVNPPLYADINNNFNGDAALNSSVINEPLYFITSYFNARSRE